MGIGGVELNPGESQSGRILLLEECINVCRDAHKTGERIVLTNGCFDILHRGHVEYLQASAQLGSRLVVAVNSDRSVRELKGATRPVQCEEDRATILASLRCVDWVFIFEGPRLANEIRQLRPDVYTKAGDYTMDTLEASERFALQESQAEIVFMPFLSGRSTTGILAKQNLGVQSQQ